VIRDRIDAWRRDEPDAPPGDESVNSAPRPSPSLFATTVPPFHTREMDWTALKLLLEGIEPGKWRKRYRLAQEKKDNTNTVPSL
jgi:hypothetical protein